MATCSNCGTENKENAAFCANCRRPLPRKLGKLTGSKTTSGRVVEQVPDWLYHLLSKFGEAPGRLVGLEEAVELVKPEQEPGEKAVNAGLANLLEQMAEEGIDSFSSEQLPTSVEWGSYANVPAQESPPLDDLLSNLGEVTDSFETPSPYSGAGHRNVPSPEAAEPDWLSEMLPPVPAVKPRHEQADQGATPEWLAEMFGADEIPAPPPISPAAPTPADKDVPEWLAETLENPADLEQPVTPSIEAGEELPDWLSERLEIPAAISSRPETPAEPGRDDTFDWNLVEPTPEPAEGKPAVPEASIPDWLLEGEPPAESPSVPVEPAAHEDEEPFAVVPDWLSEMTSPGADRTAPAAPVESEDLDWQVPDWLENITTASTESPAPPEPGVPSEEAEAPDWLALFDSPSPAGLPSESAQPPGQSLAGIDSEETIPDWLLAVESPPGSRPETPGEAELPDWLIGESTADQEAAAETVTSGPDEAVPGWLAQLQVSPPPARGQTASVPEWLARLETPGATPARGPAELPGWLVVLQPGRAESPSPALAPPGAGPSRLTRISRLQPVPEKKSDELAAPAEQEDRLVAVEPVPESTSRPGGLKSLKRLTPEADVPPLPDWVAALVPPAGVSPATRPDLPAWAATLVPAQAALSMGAARVSLPDWIEALIPPGFETAPPPPAATTPPKKLSRLSETPAEAPSLKRLSRLGDTSEDKPDLSLPSGPPKPPDRSESGRPPISVPGEDETLTAAPDDWLAQLSGLAAVTEETTDVTDWEVSDSFADQDNLAERLGWLTGTGETPTVTSGEESPPAELPDWLDELPEPPVIAQTAEPAGLEEIVESDWLAGISETPVEAVPATEAELDWLAGLREVPAEAAEAELPAEAEVPDWLVQAEQAPVEGVESAEGEAELPDWLAGLRAAPTEAAEVPTEATEAELPDWLAEAEQVPAEEAEAAEDEAELPDWLAGLREAPTEEVEVPDWLAELPAAPIEAAEAELPAEAEVPDWLAEAEQVPAEEVEAAEGEAELPSWLAGLRAAPTEANEAELAAEAKMPDWLAQVEETPAEAAEAELPVEAEVPDWLAELPAAPIEAAEAELPAETEVPDWLVEAEQAPAEEVEAAEGEAELPSWLAGLREVPAEGDKAELAAEAEMPDWLAQVEETPAEAAEAELPAEAEVPDWLAEVEQAPAEEAEVAEGEAELPGWLAGLREAPTEEAEVPDWLAELPAAPIEAAEAEQAPAEEAEVAEGEAELPGWLAGLRAAPAEAAEAELATEAEMPDWLAELPAAPIEAAEAELPAEAEVPDWLAEAEQAPAEEVEAAEGEAELPDWLAGLREVPAEGDEAEMPDWLAQVEETPAEADEAELPAEAEVPDWLAEVPAAPIEAAEAELPAEAEVPDWLAEAEQAPAEEAEAAEGEAELPDWLAGLRAAPAEGDEAELAAEAEMPDWLAQVEETPAEAAEAELPAEAEVPDWLAEIEQAPAEAVEAEPVGEEEAPDWLAEAEQALAEGVETVEGEEESDWLAGLHLVSGDETESELVGEAEAPDWLAETEQALAEGGQAAPVEEAETEPGTGGESPDWLAELPELSLITRLEKKVPAEESPELPDWLASLRAAPTEAAEAELTDEPAVPDWLAELPPLPAEAEPVTETEALGGADDLAAEAVKTGQTAEPERAVDEVMTEAEPEVPDWLVEPAEAVAENEPAEAELPDWLASLPPVPAEAEGKAAPVVEAQASEEEPAQVDWLSNLTMALEVSEETDESLPPVEAFDADLEPELPGWLTEDPGELNLELLKPGRSKPDRPDSEPAGTPERPIEYISEWLQSMAAAPEKGEEAHDETVETTGILGGLPGLLPAARMSPVTSLPGADPGSAGGQAASITEAARQFYAIATQIPQPVPLPPLPSQRDQVMGRITRGLLYLLFMALVALPLLPGLQKIDPATSTQRPWTEPVGELQEVLDQQRRELIGNQLGVVDLQQPNTVALVSFDYTAATQGEMQPLAEAMIGRLRGQGMRVIAISLEPEGPALAQAALREVLADREETYGREVVNLGYVPGQVAGVRALLTGSRPLADMADFQEGLTFKAPERVNWLDVQDLNQVNLLVTIADNPATARWWIEQVELAALKPAGDQRLLLAATSAAADPFLRPYREAAQLDDPESKQLDGLISGINGAAALEAGRKTFGPARQMLDSLSVAHLIIVIVIAAGTIAGWMPPAPAAQRKEAAPSIPVEEGGE